MNDAFDGRLYQYCPNRQNLFVTHHPWAAYAYGLGYYVGYTQAGKGFYCVAYCVP